MGPFATSQELRSSSTSDISHIIQFCKFKLGGSSLAVLLCPICLIFERFFPESIVFHLIDYFTYDALQRR
ncbi:hypothetical protein Leryth_022915 [Lithospermum erythrorhizon]|nr:hypothetical protein Leryth_022915 [Lithospermum erythrorhizon]